jgi:hypothetical protein
MIRNLALSAVTVLLVADLAIAEPELRVSYPAGVPRIEISGSYPQSHYTVWRRLPADPQYAPLTDGDVLCLGSCYAMDRGAEPGQSYLYRFDLLLADGSRVSFGPYTVTISAKLAARLRASVWPNPGRGSGRLELFVGGEGGPIEAEAGLFDVQGRAVATLHRGLLPRGMNVLAWDGRGNDGRSLEGGLYFLRFASPLGTTVTRVLRLR